MTYRNIDNSSLTFEQDRRLSFEKVSHTYHVEGIGYLMSVSHVIAFFFKTFDANAISLRITHGDAIAAERLREEWDIKGTIANQLGTFLHKQIERYLNGEIHPEMICPIHYEGKYHQFDKTLDITREWNFFKNFDRDTEYHPFRTEWGVYNGECGIAGTIDLICSRNDGTYEIYDWKRSNKINPCEKNRWESGLHGLEHLTDTSYIHYCLQQNLYRYLIEKKYGLKISRMNLVVLHPDYFNYRIVPIPFMEREVELIIDYMCRHRK